MKQHRLTLKRFDSLLRAMATDPNLPESLQKTIEHQIRYPAQVMAILELATQTQPFSL